MGWERTEPSMMNAAARCICAAAAAKAVLVWVRCALDCAAATTRWPHRYRHAPRHCTMHCLQAGACGVECKTVERAAEQIMGEHDTDVAEALFVVSELPAAWSRGCLVHVAGGLRLCNFRRQRSASSAALS